MNIFGGHDIYGGHDPDLREYRTSPFIEQQLLNPVSDIWKPGNIFLRLFPQQLYPCVGERTVRACDSTLPPRERARAKKELESLRKSIRKYFKRTGRPGGRPSKLTPADRRQIPDEHSELCKMLREHCKVEKDELVLHEDLKALFSDQSFLQALFARFPMKGQPEKDAWPKFLKATSALGVSDRCLHYLGLRYDVSHHTIHRVIWPERSRT
jgi:hypothetical protein